MSVTTDEMRGHAAWFDSPLGRALLRTETELLIHGVRRCHGDTMLWLGPVALPNVELDRCMVRHRVYGSMSGQVWPADGGSSAVTYSGCIEALPFAPASMDAVVLHHALDCCRDPRMAMREVCKVLRPGGRLLVCGFNPFSLWGARRLAAQLHGNPFGRFRFVSPLRLVDWLAVLGIEADEGIQYSMFRPPFTFGSFERRSLVRVRDALRRARLPFGGIYFLMGRKTAAGVTPLRVVPRLRPALPGTALPGPTARQGQ
jgi:SAM-dependent methyltransferase